MKIFVLISTIDRRVLRVPEMVRVQETDVHYVVVWQTTREWDDIDLSDLTARKDVTLVAPEGHGLSRSRNLAMETALGLLSEPTEDAVFVIADDDETFRSDAFGLLNSYYLQHPDVDIALMRTRSNISRHYFKKYPAKECDYRKRPRSYYPISVEMTIRSRVCHAGIRFDERFGLGSYKLCAGEEDIFLTDALDSGLRIVITPIDLAYTRPQTTGSRHFDTKVLRSKGAVYGYTRSWAGAFLRSLREAVSLSVRHRRRFIPVFRKIWYGVKYIRNVS